MRKVWVSVLTVSFVFNSLMCYGVTDAEVHKMWGVLGGGGEAVFT